MIPRVIPVLLLRDGGLVKTKRFKDAKYVGDPTNAIRIFNEKEVDELVVLDIGASRSSFEPNYEVIRLFAEECFMPLTYGGGIASLDQASKIFDLGVEKVSLQSAALLNPKLVSEISRKYGQQSVVVSVDVKKDWLGRWKLYDSRNKKKIKKTVTNFLLEIIEAGAGEILLNSVDRDGMLNGYDLELIRLVSATVSVPVVALGGASSIADFRDGLMSGASAVAAGSMFVFKGPHQAVLISYPARSDLKSLEIKTVF